jgi:hypothetical protein
MEVSLAFDCIALFPNLRNLRLVEQLERCHLYGNGSDEDAEESKRRVTEEVQKRVNMVGAGHALSALNISIHKRSLRRKAVFKRVSPMARHDISMERSIV